MGNCINKQEIEGAGCFFTDGQYVIAGYQPYKKKISGIGGKKKEGESFHDTALRETLEELFEMHIQPPAIVDELKMIPLRSIYNNSGYTNIVYTFKDLLKILNIINKHGYKSRVYPEFPLTIEDLISKRLLIPDCEISNLMLLPLTENLVIDPLFVKDITDIKSVLRRPVKLLL